MVRRISRVLFGNDPCFTGSQLHSMVPGRSTIRSRIRLLHDSRFSFRFHKPIVDSETGPSILTRRLLIRILYTLDRLGRPIYNCMCMLRSLRYGRIVNVKRSEVTHCVQTIGWANSVSCCGRYCLFVSHGSSIGFLDASNGHSKEFKLPSIPFRDVLAVRTVKRQQPTDPVQVAFVAASFNRSLVYGKISLCRVEVDGHVVSKEQIIEQIMILGVTLSKSIGTKISTLMSTMLSRRLALYGPEYIDALNDLDELNLISDTDQRHFQPVKPPFGARTLSFFYDNQVRRFISIMMWEGDREMSERILDKAFFYIKAIQVKKINETGDSSVVVNPRQVLHLAIQNVKPIVNITKCFRGGVSYTIPTPAPDYYKEFMAIKWIIQAAETDKVSPYRIWQRLAHELIDGMNKRGRAYEKKIELHRTAEANRAFAHFRWL
ncbi:hypothetical protein ACOME3_002494 [Neoechinorhynchus agilis]